jgi:hypothetical protein
MTKHLNEYMPLLPTYVGGVTNHGIGARAYQKFNKHPANMPSQFDQHFFYFDMPVFLANTLQEYQKERPR